jgi:hypothetical protein
LVGPDVPKGEKTEHYAYDASERAEVASDERENADDK